MPWRSREVGGSVPALGGRRGQGGKGPSRSGLTPAAAGVRGPGRRTPRTGGSPAAAMRKGMESEVTILLENQAGPAPEWVRLLPLGEVALGDGREPLAVDAEALADLVDRFEERGLDLVIDYEHQTLSGGKAPAAGWIRELEARDDGLWARVEWTDTAREHLAAREYRYFSPVLRLEDKTRRPLALLHAALTNTPAINGQTPLVAKCGVEGGRSSQPAAVRSPKGGASGEAEGQIPPTPPFIKGGTYGKGLEDLPTDSPGATGGAGESEGGLRADREQAAPGRGNGLGAEWALGAAPEADREPLGEVARLLDLPRDAGLSRIRGAILALRRNLEHLAGAHAQLAALRGNLAEREINAAVEHALATGKIQPCQQEEALSFARRDLEGFKTFVEQSLPQVPLAPLPPWQEEPARPREEGPARSSRMAVCRALGVAPEDFAARERRLRDERLL